METFIAFALQCYQVLSALEKSRKLWQFQGQAGVIYQLRVYKIQRTTNASPRPL